MSRWGKLSSGVGVNRIGRLKLKETFKRSSAAAAV